MGKDKLGRGMKTGSKKKKGSADVQCCSQRSRVQHTLEEVGTPWKKKKKTAALLAKLLNIFKIQIINGPLINSVDTEKAKNGYFETSNFNFLPGKACPQTPRISQPLPKSPAKQTGYNIEVCVCM